MNGSGSAPVRFVYAGSVPDKKLLWIVRLFVGMSD
ncbi:hypothetical protein SAMN05421863_104912 [Nitrosomonas communis]|uniref:Uncharacterized protein n=1 Tax=Nitrosomonas communis TaxID=44574 RepID=A0A1I4TC65_9PROT|nr:hypothetical protein SAMN05421863_104912 [Nitrosomonas communis]